MLRVLNVYVYRLSQGGEATEKVTFSLYNKFKLTLFRVHDSYKKSVHTISVLYRTLSKNKIRWR